MAILFDDPPEEQKNENQNPRIQKNIESQKLTTRVWCKSMKPKRKRKDTGVAQTLRDSAAPSTDKLFHFKFDFYFDLEIFVLICKNTN